MKQTKRKAFNFLRSYFDVLNEIPEDKDKLDFLLSIINKQFLNENPNKLNFITNLCYESQRHAIEKSVKGWLLANKSNCLADPVSDPSSDPTLHHTSLPISDPKEEEEEEEEKEKEQLLYSKKNNFDDYYKVYITYCKEIMQDAGLLESLARKYKMTADKKVYIPTVKKYLTMFLAEFLISKKIHDNRSSFNTHFNNWLNKQPVIKNVTVMMPNPYESEL